MQQSVEELTIDEHTAADTGADALVGGPTAGFIDQSDRIAERLGSRVDA